MLMDKLYKITYFDETITYEAMVMAGKMKTFKRNLMSNQMYESSDPKQVTYFKRQVESQVS